MAKAKRLTIGILAHVDAGKTTLSEAMLYHSGRIKSMGRVDHKNAFLDTDTQEKDRGITIFSKQAEFTIGDGETEVMLLDTPGHVDFSAEMERTLSVLDYAILVISGKDGVQSHTVTLWKLLQKYEVPVFVFINKMDLDGTDEDRLLTELKETLDPGCSVLTDLEELATCDDELLEEYLTNGTLENDSIARAVYERSVFPCFFGSALKPYGVSEFMQSLQNLTLRLVYTDPGNVSGPNDFRGRVFKITRDQGERLTHIKVLGGVLRVKDEIDGEKVNQIRIYSGQKYRTVDSAESGMLCAVTGLVKTSAGYDAELEPVMSYRVIPPAEVNDTKMLEILRQLEDEDPMLNVSWNPQIREIQVKLMGEIQLEVLSNIINERFGFEVTFGQGQIAYKETITEPVTGAGHFEPLRHYAEVQLLLEPLPNGSGLSFGTLCSEDVLDKNWQRLIMTHFLEKEYTGALTNSPITDMKISILTGRAHKKHTEGGDFRQSTYRAIRQGLRKSAALGQVVLLEPWYEFRLELPGDMVGRAMADIQRMSGTFEAPEMRGDNAILEGQAPVSEMKSYITEVAMYTKGYGRLMVRAAGYRPCHNQDEVIERIGYDPDRDIENTGDSVFCSHGTGINIPWYESDEMMHMSNGLKDTREEETEFSPKVTSYRSGPSFEDDDELRRIFENTYGSLSGKNTGSRKKWKAKIEPKEYVAKVKIKESLPEYLLVDGYNIIFAWPDLKELAKVSIDAARDALIEILCNYQGFKKCKLMVVFDAYKVKGGERHIEQQAGISVVYTKEAEIADTFIERTTYELSGKGAVDEEGKRQKYSVKVATSDRLEQIIIMGNDAIRMSAKDFIAEVEMVNKQIEEVIARNNRQNEIASVKIGHIFDKKQ